MFSLPKPLYKSKEAYAKDNDNIPFVELDFKNYTWLHNFATNVSVKKPNFNHPFLDYRLDVKNPGICAYRLYVDSDIPGNPPNFIHVQIQKLYDFPWLYLLYYFDKQEASDMANKLVTIFKEILIYMRPWAYGEDNRHSAKITEIVPFPERVF